ncbi:MAG: hypothetical protein K2Y37_09085 [Pirellulales bacterium]|nr:hypothetical protein [Pirellulales bacterium]
MVRAGRYRTLRWLLSALLAATTTMPPGLCHAHARGDVPHRHDRVSADHRHSHRHTHAHPRDVAPPRAHVHLSWLGFEFTLPASHEPHDGSSAGDRQAPCFVRPSDETAADIRSLAGSTLIAMVAPVTFFLPAVVERPITARAPLPAYGTLLCDTARHERSGVQLS